MFNCSDIKSSNYKLFNRIHQWSFNLYFYKANQSKVFIRNNYNLFLESADGYILVFLFFTEISIK